MRIFDKTVSENTAQIRAENFGPIVEASIDYRPLTVFVGPSNTGKSYFAILIYAIHKFFSRRESEFYRHLIYGRQFNTQDRMEKFDELHSSINEALETILGEHRTSNETDISIPSEIVKKIILEMPNFFTSLNEEICRCFGIEDVKFLMRHHKHSGNIQITNRFLPGNNYIRFRHHFSKRSRKTEVSIQKNVSPAIDRKTFDFLTQRSRSWNVDQRKLVIFNTLQDFVYSHITRPLNQSAYYLPASRTGVMHTNRIVLSALIAQASRTGQNPTPRIPMLSGVITDFLNDLINIDQPHSGGQQTFEEFGRSIEESILRGSVFFSKSDISNYPHFSYRPDGLKADLPLTNTSSMVSELAPIVLYLRHIVVKDNILIIEEPESHIHPHMQVQLIRQLATLVNAGVRIVITTHSEWIIEELSNIVRRSQVPSKKKENDYKQKALLQAKDVGVWLFEEKGRPRGTVVKELVLDESGSYPSKLDDLSIALYDDWLDISREIERTQAAGQ